MSDIGLEFAQRQRAKEHNDAAARAAANDLLKRTHEAVCSQLRRDTETFNSHRVGNEAKLKMNCQDDFISVGGILPGALIKFEDGEVEVKAGQTMKEPIVSYERFKYFEHKGKLQFKNIFFEGAGILDLSGFIRVVFETLLPSGHLA